MSEIIKTVGELKRALSGIEDDVVVAIEDADTDWLLNIKEISITNRHGLTIAVLETDYKLRIGP